MIVQKDSALQVIKRCRKLGKKIVAGGPLFTTGYEEFREDVDHLVLGEAETTLPEFLDDLAHGRARALYQAEKRPDIKETPVPQWNLIDINNYALMAVQYSRGCPFNCEFCDIIIMNGRTPRVKSTPQILREFEVLYRSGWRGQVLIVDDNFIGNTKKVKEMLKALVPWMRERSHPFVFLTEASINLADDDELLKLMADAGFQRVFVGIESPNRESLQECNKFQNMGRDIVASVKKIHRHGLEVLGGFIVGFDSDPPSIFEQQIRLIRESGIVTAMVGLLNAFPGTTLYNRLKKENRILKKSSGNNVDGSINFIPVMDMDTLKEGHRTIVRTIYSPGEYYRRVKNFLTEYRPGKLPKVRWTEIQAFIKSIWFLGIRGKSRKYYWKLFFWSLFTRPKVFPMAVTMAICGFHFNKVLE
jgi:radical SAM superfamily enzyme YgiQ (UPF0313 family)